MSYIYYHICHNVKHYFYCSNSVRRPRAVQTQSYLLCGRSDHPTLGRPFCSLHPCAVLLLERRLQPSFDMEKEPWFLSVPPHRFHQKLEVNVVEQALDVKLQNPVILPASLPCDLHRIECRFSRP